MKDHFAFAVNRLKPLLWAFALVPFFIIMGTEFVKTYNSAIHPVRDCFRPLWVEVADSVYGEDAELTYSRTLNCAFVGTYNVVVNPVDGDIDYPACSNSETLNYIARKPGPPKKMPLSQFVGKPCHPAPGQYYLVANWEVKRLWHRPAYVQLSTKVWTVHKLEGKVP